MKSYDNHNINTFKYMRYIWLKELLHYTINMYVKKKLNRIECANKQWCQQDVPKKTCPAAKDNPWQNIPWCLWPSSTHNLLSNNTMLYDESEHVWTWLLISFLFPYTNLSSSFGPINSGNRFDISVASRMTVLMISDLPLIPTMFHDARILGAETSSSNHDWSYLKQPVWLSSLLLEQHDLLRKAQPHHERSPFSPLSFLIHDPRSNFHTPTSLNCM